MGMASSRSRPLPWGTPSMMSMSTTSASSLDAIQWAAVAPTLPEPTILTFLRMDVLSGGDDDLMGKPTILNQPEDRRLACTRSSITGHRLTFPSRGNCFRLREPTLEKKADSSLRLNDKNEGRRVESDFRQYPRLHILDD